MNPYFLKLTAVMSAAILLSGTALAQQPDRQGRRGMMNNEDRVNRMVEQYDLSEEQAGQLMQVFEEGKANRPNVRGKSREEARPEVCQFILKTHDDIMEILTAEQGEQFTQDMQERARGRGLSTQACEEFRDG